MITTVILAIIALASTVWAFVERYGKKALSAIINGLNIDIDKLKNDFVTIQGLLKHEKEARMREELKSMELQRKLAEHAIQETMKAPETPEIASVNTMNIADLVDVTEQYQLGENERAVHFEFYKDQPREMRWRLKAKNNKILADSGEGYGSKQNLKKALGVMLGAILNGELKSKWRA